MPVFAGMMEQGRSAKALSLERVGDFLMRSLFAIIVLTIFLPTTNALADSCYDLWYQRNLIYAENGYCFKTDLARRTFSDSSCRTDHPQFSPREQRRINQIKAEERERGCNVN